MQHSFYGCSKFISVLFSQLDGTTRQRILVPSASLKKQRCSPWKFVFQFSLSVSTIITGPLVPSQYCIVACITKGDSYYLIGIIHYLEYRDSIIIWTIQFCLCV